MRNMHGSTVRQKVVDHEVVGLILVEAYWSTHSNFGTEPGGHIAPSHSATWHLLIGPPKTQPLIKKIQHNMYDLPHVNTWLVHLSTIHAQSPTDVNTMSPIHPAHSTVQSTLQVDFLVFCQKLQNTINFTYGVGLRRFKCPLNQNNEIYNLALVSNDFENFDFWAYFWSPKSIFYMVFTWSFMKFC